MHSDNIEGKSKLSFLNITDTSLFVIDSSDIIINEKM